MEKTNDDREICAGHSVDNKTLAEIKVELKKEEGVDRLSRIFKAMGDPSRLKIIYVLAKSSLCVCDIASLLDMTQSSISHHLRVLRDLNLVKFKREGKLVIYSLDDEHVFKLFMEGLEHTRH